MKCTQEATYLGSLLTENLSPNKEMSQQLAAANTALQTLQAFWAQIKLLTSNHAYHSERGSFRERTLRTGCHTV